MERRCPSCGQAPAARTIWPDAPGGHFGTCADEFHDYPWIDETDDGPANEAGEGKAGTLPK